MEDQTDAPKNGKNVFNLSIHTDGFGPSIIFARVRNKEDRCLAELDLEGFHKDELESLFLPIAIDPGRKKIFTTTVMHSSNEQVFRRCSSKERQCQAGTLRRYQKAEKLKDQGGISTLKRLKKIYKRLTLD